MAFIARTMLLPSGFYSFPLNFFGTKLSYEESILQDSPQSFIAQTIQLQSGFYFFHLISSTKIIPNNTNGY